MRVLLLVHMLVVPDAIYAIIGLAIWDWVRRIVACWWNDGGLSFIRAVKHWVLLHVVVHGTRICEFPLFNDILLLLWPLLDILILVEKHFIFLQILKRILFLLLKLFWWNLITELVALIYLIVINRFDWANCNLWTFESCLALHSKVFLISCRLIFKLLCCFTTFCLL